MNGVFDGRKIAVFLFAFLLFVGFGSNLDGTTVRASMEPPTPSAKAEPAIGEIGVEDDNYEDGKLNTRRHFKRTKDADWIQHGLEISYWPDGAKKSEMPFVEGLKHGLRITWYEDGQKWSEGHYVQGLEDGVWTTWFPNGSKYQDITLKNSGFEGPFTQWHMNGKMRLQVEYVAGKMQGPMRVWDQEGHLNRAIDYVDNEPQP